MWSEISAVIVAVALVVLVIYLIGVLKSLKTFLDGMGQNINQIKNEVTDISKEVKGLIQTTNQITADVTTKLDSLDPLFNTVNDIGQMTNDLTSSVKNTANEFVSLVRSKRRTEVNKEYGKVYSLFNGIAAAMRVWNRIK
ncbi:MAG TPA: DUF948 domain-containing protein, partial [Bacilli bacterium]